jgi:hypothetical protein
MCNLYSMLKSQDAIRAWAKIMVDKTGNLPPIPGIYPDYSAPILRQGTEGRELAMARWGMPTPPRYLVGKKTDSGVTNIRNPGLAALASLAGLGESVRGALHVIRGAGAATRRPTPANLVRALAGAAAGLVRRHLDAVDVREEGQGGRGHDRSVRLPDHHAE